MSLTGTHVPFDIDGANAVATFESGILRLVLPKAETAKPRKIEIRTSTPLDVSTSVTNLN